MSPLGHVQTWVSMPLLLSLIVSRWTAVWSSLRDVTSWGLVEDARLVEDEPRMFNSSQERNIFGSCGSLLCLKLEWILP